MKHLAGTARIVHCFVAENRSQRVFADLYDLARTFLFELWGTVVQPEDVVGVAELDRRRVAAVP